ncbi:MAG TPA: four-carbon acid sugar kinase family protein [Pirellulales bacterium]|jgi:uncharacterized protein YgbK (DUF1537 family)
MTIPDRDAENSTQVAYYGDDFTGSTDVLEMLSLGGIRTVLFTRSPTAKMLQRYAGAQAIGLAGTSRAMSPEEMDRSLPPVFETLKQLRPKFIHYKTCSTFDSAPQIGNIGRAIEIGKRICQSPIVPLVVGAPALGRYCVFGNLFARFGGESAPYRLDRHPSMSRHPTTPMAEADLRRHLAAQTERRIELIDWLTLDRGLSAVLQCLKSIQSSGDSVVLFDTLTDAHLATIGAALCELQSWQQQPLFVAGSSGIEHALVKHCNNQQRLSPDRVGIQAAVKRIDCGSKSDPVDQTLVVSGSCSPVTHRQIAWALANGFAEVSLDAQSLVDADPRGCDLSQNINQLHKILAAGQSAIVHTAGPALEKLAAPKAESASLPAHVGNLTAATLGVILGRILREGLKARPLKRIAIVGGDTSGHVAMQLGIEALEMAGPLETGAPLCLARSSTNPQIDGVEVTFKGGQVGRDDFFGKLLSGRTDPHEITRGK